MFVALLVILAAAATPVPPTPEVSSADEHVQYWTRTVQTHPMQTIRKNAARVLGTLGDRSVIPVLVGALSNDTFFGVRAEAARSLGNLADERAISALQDASQKDTDAQVRKNARDAVDKIKAVMEFRRKRQERLDKKGGATIQGFFEWWPAPPALQSAS